MKNIPFLLVFLFAYSSVAALFPAPLVRNPFTTNSGAKIVGAGSGITVSSNNAGIWTITGATTNYIATTNGVSRGLTNLGELYSDRLTVTNLVVGTNASTVVASNGNIKISGTFQSTGYVMAQDLYTAVTGGSSSLNLYMCCGSLYDKISSDGSGAIPAGVLTFSRSDTGDQLGIRMGGFWDQPGKAIQFTKTNGFLYLTSGDSTYANSTNRFHINEVNSRGVTVTNSSTENVSITNGVVNATKALIIGTNLSSVVVSNGHITTTGSITVASPSSVLAHSFRAVNIVDTPMIYSSYWGGNYGGMAKFDVYETGVVQLRDINGSGFNRLIFGLESSNFPALKRNGASLEIVNALGSSRATNNLIVPGVVISTNGFILPAPTPLTPPTSLSGQGGHLWSDGTNLCIVLQNSAGTRFTNKVTMTAWP